MNAKVLSMILKIREWDEEIEKQKFAILLTERRRIELTIAEIEERFQFISSEKYKWESSSEGIALIYSEIEYLTERLAQLREFLEKLDQEIEKQRYAYEEAFKERKKIEQLYDRTNMAIKIEKEKIEEKSIADILMSRYRS